MEKSMFTACERREICGFKFKFKITSHDITPMIKKGQKINIMDETRPSYDEC